MNTLIKDKWSKTNEAIDKITSLGYKVQRVVNSELHFTYMNKRVIYYANKEWATGSSIADCRGLGQLLKQIKPIESTVNILTVSEIKDKLTEAIANARQKSETAATEEMYCRFDASVDAFQFILDFINEKQ